MRAGTCTLDKRTPESAKLRYFTKEKKKCSAFEEPSTCFAQGIIQIAHAVGVKESLSGS